MVMTFTYTFAKPVVATYGQSNLTQLDLLETEINKQTTLLEQAKGTYQSLQKQYPEQCAAAEQYRINIRSRDETIRYLRDIVESKELEQNSSRELQRTLENRICQLEHQLSSAQETYAELDQRKNENLLLKEAIERMELEFEEMHTSITDTSSKSPFFETASEKETPKPLSLEIFALSSPVEKGENGDEEDVRDLENGGFNVFTKSSVDHEEFQTLEAITVGEIKTETDLENLATSSEGNASPLSRPLDRPSPYDSYNDEGDMKWRLCAEKIVKWCRNSDVQNDVLGEHELKAVEEALRTLCANIESTSKIESLSEETDIPNSRSTRHGSTCPYCKGKRSVGLYNGHSTSPQEPCSRLDGPFSATLLPKRKHKAFVISLVSLIGLVLSLGPSLWKQPNIPGGATVYDRQAWASFNNLEPTGEGIDVRAALAGTEDVGGGLTGNTGVWPT
ncbi:hypothetical protein K435DRAFT_862817 [Dendrothele bispora CBS 962.96]|uniref:Uncharacterized protein n=1 Tax=Dendrothele bispora (strain CBS 962.96) TaxID=1314807 RepID=A0A4S8LS24_DENBC|nr:hypothetical protein K435DRAFT_862817 [Dendrothele bispora CBS 962.96]